MTATKTPSDGPGLQEQIEVLRAELRRANNTSEYASRTAERALFHYSVADKIQVTLQWCAAIAVAAVLVWGIRGTYEEAKLDWELERKIAEACVNAGGEKNLIHSSTGANEYRGCVRIEYIQPEPIQ